MDKYTVGYSVRVIGPDSDWTDSRRKKFLLDPNVRSPKSVDINVWEETLHAKVDTDMGPLPVPCWSNRDEMRRLTSYQQSDQSTVELTIVVNVTNAVPNYVEGLALKRAVENSEGIFIGYDVADEGLTSGLCNCEYSAKDKQHAEKVYGGMLNQHGLFTAYDVAQDFARYTSIRVSEHAPFFVYSLYVDKEVK